MNLRVDLILENEQRSASAFNLKVLTRAAIIVVPSLLGLLVFWAITSYIALSAQVRSAKSEWEIKEPRKNEVLELRKKAGVNLAMLQELEGWRKTHVDWNEHLRAVQRSFPAGLQLGALTLTHALQATPQGAPTRQFTLLLKGTAYGANADRDVQALRRAIQKTAPFTNILQDVEVKQFETDPQNRENRIFQIECVYQPRLFQ